MNYQIDEPYFASIETKRKWWGRKYYSVFVCKVGKPDEFRFTCKASPGMAICRAIDMINEKWSADYPIDRHSIRFDFLLAW